MNETQVNKMAQAATFLIFILELFIRILAKTPTILTGLYSFFSVPTGKGQNTTFNSSVESRTRTLNVYAADVVSHMHSLNVCTAGAVSWKCLVLRRRP
jgi:hypothetical protein